MAARCSVEEREPRGTRITVNLPARGRRRNESGAAE